MTMPHTSTPPDDTALMLRVKEGDRRAFETLIKRHQQPLMNFFRRLGVHRDAEDLVQETFLRLYRYRDRYQPRAKLTTFLYLLARQTRIDYLRKLQRRGRLEEPMQEYTPEPALPAPERRGESSDLAQALLALPESMREAVVLCAAQGLSQAEAAVILDVPVGTVKSRVSYGLKRLRTWIKEHE